MIKCDTCPRCKDTYPGKVDMCGGYGCLARLMRTIKPADVVPYSINDDGTMTITVPKGMAVGRVFVQRK